MCVCVCVVESRSVIWPVTCSRESGFQDERPEAVQEPRINMLHVLVNINGVVL